MPDHLNPIQQPARPRLLRAGLGALLLCAAFAVQAKDAPAAAEDPALEKRTLAISAELRCLVCQNQTIADSNAGLAVDLRNQVREMLRAGKSEAEIMAYMTQRYGDFVLYRPPVKGSTALLWFGPPALLVVGGISLWLILRRRNQLGADQFEPDEGEPGLPADDAPDNARNHAPNTASNDAPAAQRAANLKPHP